MEATVLAANNETISPTCKEAGTWVVPTILAKVKIFTSVPVLTLYHALTWPFVLENVCVLADGPKFSQIIHQPATGHLNVLFFTNWSVSATGTRVIGVLTETGAVSEH